MRGRNISIVKKKYIKKDMIENGKKSHKNNKRKTSE
jgi:hypothetical protein